MSDVTVKVVRWLVVLAIPVFLVLSASRLLISDWYPRFEYAKPDFPLDRYGFTQQERTDLALVNIHFLQRPEPPDVAIQMLAELRLPGTDSPLFKPNELSHMVDVKRLTDALWRVWALAGVIVAAGEITLLARRATRWEGYQALYAGGLLTAACVGILVAFVLLSWQAFFIAFHDVFFPPGTWTFEYTDSLIRLFPDRFWSDAGTMLTVGPLLAGLLVAAAGYLLKRRTS